MNTDHTRLISSMAHQFFEEREAFTELAKKISDGSFFMTGGSGLFGTWILAFLDWSSKKKYAEPTVNILSRKKRENINPAINFIQGDIINFDFKNIKSKYTIHMAAPSALETFNGFDELKKFKTLSIGTENLLNYSRFNNEKRTVVLSSGAVYGGFDRERRKNISELEKRAPSYEADSQALSIGKRVAEFLAREYARKNLVDLSVARCFSFVGPGLPANLHYAIGNFVKCAIDGEEIVIRGDGAPVRSYMHLGDMVFWIMRILFDGKKGHDYNVGSEKGLNMLELASLITNILDVKIEIKVQGNKKEAVGNPPNYFYVPNTQKARKELNLRCHVDLKTSINDYASYLKALRYCEP